MQSKTINVFPRATSLQRLVGDDTLHIISVIKTSLQECNMHPRPQKLELKFHWILNSLLL